MPTTNAPPPPLSGANMTFAFRLRAVLARRGLTNVQAAKMTGVHISSLHGHLSGKAVPRADVLVLLCIGLQVSADELLGLVPAPDPHVDVLIASFTRYVAGIVTPLKIENTALRAALIEKRAG